MIDRFDDVSVSKSGKCLASVPHQWLAADVSLPQWRTREQNPDEPLGTKNKFWLLDSQDRSWLLKYARLSGKAVSGEHWAECVVHALSSLIGVPTACVRPAFHEGRCAIVCCSVLRDKSSLKPIENRMEHGSELLRNQIANYDVPDSNNNPDYTVINVRSTLSDVDAPSTDMFPRDGFAVWAGYLLLDAWVSGCDRHHDNWAVATDASGSKRLVESFDHGNALGFQVSDAQLEKFSNREAVKRWINRGKSHFAGRPMPLQVAIEALEMLTGEARDYWIGRLYDVQHADVEAIIAAVPNVFMSQVRRRFVLDILAVNRERILNATVK